MVMYKIVRRGGRGGGGVQKSYTRTDPCLLVLICIYPWLQWNKIGCKQSSTYIPSTRRYMCTYFQNTKFSAVCIGDFVLIVKQPQLYIWSCIANSKLSFFRQNKRLVYCKELIYAKLLIRQKISFSSRFDFTKKSNIFCYKGIQNFFFFFYSF